MNLLILYPHGLGDCILLTPALREFYKRTGHKVHVATLERFKSAQFFDHCPYVDKIFYTKDAWLDYPHSHIGFDALKQEWKTFAQEQEFRGVVMPMHSSLRNKIILNSEALGIKHLSTFNTEIFTTTEDKEVATQVVKRLVGQNSFGFIQTDTGLETKNLYKKFGQEWLKKNKGLSHFIELGENLQALDYNINVQFEIMRLATGVCLPDSVFYHACHAMNKEVDFVYFGRGREIYERVKPLHPVKENVIYKLEEL